MKKFFNVTSFLIHSLSKYSYPLFLFLVLFSFGISTVMPLQAPQRYSQRLTIPNRGEGPTDSCIPALQGFNIVNTGTEFLICHLNFIFDQFVSTTQNLFQMNDLTGKEFMNELFTPLTRFAFILIPLSLFISIIYHLIISSIGTEEISIPKDISNFFLRLLLLLLLPTIFSLGIDCENILCKSIISLLSPLQQSNVFTTVLVQRLQLNELMQNGFIPGTFDMILWGALFLSLLTISFFFILRFILLWAIILMLPVTIALETLPGILGLKEHLVTLFIEFLFIQPFFILTLSIFFILTDGTYDPITKFLLGYFSLQAVGLLPILIIGYAGGKIHESTNQIIQNKMKPMIILGGNFLHSLGT